MPLLDENKKEEKIQGVIYNMSPSAGLDHANVNGNIYGALYAWLKDSLCRVYIENADLYMDKTNLEYVIPDIMIICDTKEFKKNTTKYYGIPRLVVETLSPSTAHKDRTVKKDFYARKGICEYWIIDYKSQSIEIYYLDKSSYELVNVLMKQDDIEEENYNLKEEIHLREFPDICITLEDIFRGIGEY